MRGLSLVVANGGHSSSQCAGLSLSRPLLLQSTGSRCTGSVVVAHGPSCSAACGIFPDQCSNPCCLHWQADSQPLRHHGSPGRWILNHCATREVPSFLFITKQYSLVWNGYTTSCLSIHQLMGIWIVLPVINNAAMNIWHKSLCGCISKFLKGICKVFQREFVILLKSTPIQHPSSLLS